MSKKRLKCRAKITRTVLIKGVEDGCTYWELGYQRLLLVGLDSIEAHPKNQPRERALILLARIFMAELQ